MRLMSVIVWTVATFAPTAPAAAQRLAEVALGKHVRIVSADGTVVSGEFSGIRGDTVLVSMARVERPALETSRSREPVASRIALADVQSYALRVRTRRGVGFGAASGALVGGGLGAAIFAVARASDRHWGNPAVDESDLESRALARHVAIVLTVAGSMVGALVGPKTWVVPHGVHAMLRAPEAGVGMALSVRF
jgi:hypothetical protein